MKRPVFTVILLIFCLLPAALFAVDEVILVNDTGFTIYYAYVSSSDASGWGDDVLGSTVLSDGESMSVSLGKSQGCLYDFKFIDVDDDQYIFTQNICDQNRIVVTLADLGSNLGEPRNTGSSNSGGKDVGGSQGFTLYNDTGYTFYYVYASPSSASSWGDDQLGATVLMDGDSMWIDLSEYGSECIYDIKCQDVDEDTYTRYNVNLCEENSQTFRLSDID